MALQVEEAAAGEEPVGVPAVVLGYSLVPAKQDCLSCRLGERWMLAAAATDHNLRSLDVLEAADARCSCHRAQP